MFSATPLLGLLAKGVLNATPENGDGVTQIPPLVLNAIRLAHPVANGVPLNLTSSSVVNTGVIVQQVGVGTISGRILTLTKGVWEVEILYTCACTAGGGGTMVEIVLRDLATAAVLGFLSIGQFSINQIDRIKSIFSFIQDVRIDIDIFGQAAQTTDGNAVGYAHRLL